MANQKMKIEIWSDVTCPFCFTAKRNFEKALAQFKDGDKIEVVWKSFELAPGLKTDPTKYVPQFLAELKGITLEHSKAMIDSLSNSVKEVGLEFRLDKAIPANSFNAHCFSHFAKDHGRQSEAEESLFNAYFTRGLNIDDMSVLSELAKEIGLDQNSVDEMKGTAKYADEVRQDIDEARELGITSVPFFRFNASTSLSGAQDSSIFLETLESAFALWQSQSRLANTEAITARSCEIGDECK